MRFWVLILAMVAGCECPRIPTLPATSELRVAPAELDFGPIAIGASHTLPVTFTNAGRAPLVVPIEVSDQFTSSETELSLEGGEARDILFTFTPTREGPARIELEGFTLVLQGLGLPPCVASTCRSSAFELATRTCVDSPLADGETCQAACLNGAGTCLQGSCVGTATAACDDDDRCTIDGCRSDGGCLHVPATAPTRSACEVAVCDPQRGFEYQNVEDGTLCGEPTCSFARVCFNGACTQRPTANAPDDCKYTGVCTSRSFGGDMSCATTRSGRMRCWGSPDLLRRDGGSSLPEFLPGVSDAQRPVCVQGKPRWLDSARHLQPDNPIASSGFTEFVDVRGDRRSLNTPQAFRALTPEGVYLVSSYGFDVSVVADGGVERLCSVEFFIRDGGWLFDTATPDVPRFPRPVRSCARPINPAFVFDDGSAQNSIGTELADGGVTLVGTGGNAPAVLFFGAQTLFAYSTPRAGPTWPFVPVQVTEEWGSLCGVSAAGDLACMAAIDGTRLSPRPDLPMEVGDGGFRWIRAGDSYSLRQSVMLIDSAGRLFATDGRYSAGIIDAGSSTLVPTGGATTEPVTSTSRSCLVHGTTMRCFLEDGGTSEVPDVVATSDDGAFVSTGVTTRGELVDAEGRVLMTGVLPGSNRYCQASADGGITCGLTSFAAPGPFKLDTFHGGGGCFVTPQFEAWCFWSGLPQRIPLPFGVRLVSGNLNRGCAVIGNNGVRCWGLGSRFKSVALEGRLAQISVTQTQNDLIACALTDTGRVFCWGNNELGGLGINPYDNSFIVPLE